MIYRLKKVFSAAVLGAVALIAPSAAFAICDVEYKVQAGDNLFSIAEKHYGDHSRWSIIYYRNQTELVGSSVVPGRSLYIPCPLDNPEPDATPLRQTEAELTLLTGNNNQPFTDQSLPGDGMVTELLNAALELAPQPVSYSVSWHNKWSDHLDILDSQDFDMGFPWYKPDCEATPDNRRCADFHFSEPLMTMPVMLFTLADKQFAFTKDEDIEGRTICRPAAWFSFDLDWNGRNWLKDEKIKLVRPETPADCFALLDDGQVEAVSLSVFLGAATLMDLGLRDRVVPLERPVSEVGLHVIISKRHWRGTAHLYRVNAGLKALKNSGRFDEILNRHLAAIWGRLQ